jgi:hypothetical protein
MSRNKGILRKKREELEFLAALSSRPDAELARLIEEGNAEAITEHYRVIQYWVDQTLIMTLLKCVQILTNQETWAKLADRPAKFDSLLDKIFKGTERCLKLIHRIPDHRPTDAEERDQRLDELQKEFPNATWGQIAMKYNTRFGNQAGDKINAKSAREAVVRLRHRRAKYQQDIVSRAINAAASSLQTASLKDEEVLTMLPTPEDVLKLLISDSTEN